MRVRLISTIFSFILFCVSTPLSAATGFSVSGGYSEPEDVSFFRGALKIAPGWTWFAENDWHLGAHIDLAFLSLNSQSDVTNTTNAPDSLQGIALTPVFRLQRKPFENTIAPFIEAAVGASLFSEDTLQNSEPIGLQLGGSFQFEDMISVGFKFGEHQQFEISANYFHYSNLGFYDDNDGIDIVAATLAVWF